VNLSISHAGSSDRGLVRKENEDNWFADPEQSLYIVSDGLGGEFAGALASKIVVETLPEMIRAQKEIVEELPPRKASRAIKAVLAELSTRINEETRGQPGLEGMGATVVIALIRPPKALIAHMGDSRAYLLRREHLKRLTQDHSVIQLLMDAGEISLEEATTHPARGQVTRSVGMEGEPLPEARLVTVQPNDRILLCTDGLTGMLGDQEILDILHSELVPQAACQCLINAANKAGGKDNVTAVVLDIIETQATGDKYEAAEQGKTRR
jgi:PPM family protein phosphatase